MAMWTSLNLGDMLPATMISDSALSRQKSHRYIVLDTITNGIVYEPLELEVTTSYIAS